MMLIGGTLERVTKGQGGNVFIERDEYVGALAHCGHLPEIPALTEATFMGRSVLFVGNKVMLFTRCEYCHSRERPVNNVYFGHYCPKCGGPVSAK